MTTHDREVTTYAEKSLDDVIDDARRDPEGTKEPGTIREFLNSLQGRDTELAKEIKRRQEHRAKLNAEIKVLRKEREQITRFLNASKPRKARQPKTT